MKTKNMRKKALVSSLAMLLVAVVALSGATFAWFSANSTATATGLNIKASQASSLQFAEVPSGQNEPSWGYTIALYPSTSAALTFAPCSSVDGAAFFEASAASGTTAHGSSTVVGDVARLVADNGSTSKEGYWYSKTFLVKAGADGDLVLSDFDAGGLESALRIAVTVGDGNNAQTTIFAADKDEASLYAISSAAYHDLATAQKTKTYSDFYTGNSVSGVQAYTVGTFVATGTQGTPIYSLESSVQQTITITAWLEGNDASCDDSLASATTGAFTLTFSLQGD